MRRVKIARYRDPARGPRAGRRAFNQNSLAASHSRALARCPRRQPRRAPQSAFTISAPGVSITALSLYREAMAAASPVLNAAAY